MFSRLDSFATLWSKWTDFDLKCSKFVFVNDSSWAQTKKGSNFQQTKSKQFNIWFGPSVYIPRDNSISRNSPYEHPQCCGAWLP